MLYEGVKAGDLLAVSGKGFVANTVQAATLSLPNIGPLGRWGWAGASHVAIAVPVFDELLAYESTSFNRPRCVRTNRDNPKGVQAHYIQDIVEAGGDVWHYPLRRPLYLHEEDRLLMFAEQALGRGYDFIGATRASGGILMRLLQRAKGSEDTGLMYCSELALWLWCMVGVARTKHAGMSPNYLIRWAIASGILSRGRRLT